MHCFLVVSSCSPASYTISTLFLQIHRGIFRQHKKPVAVWIFDKKGLNADKSYTKHQKEAIVSCVPVDYIMTSCMQHFRWLSQCLCIVVQIKVLKKGAAELVKLKHPSVLAITYPLAESKDR